MAEPITEEHKQQFPEMTPLILQLLWNRGLRTKEQMDYFLHPDWDRDTEDPWLFSQMKQAVDRLWKALIAKETIVIHGDYDADGVCGTALLHRTFTELGPEATIESYIPHREKEGYGLSVSTVEHLHAEFAPSLIVTVDCGISNIEPIARARELGMDVIVCDHHELASTLPEAIIIHPKAPGETVGNKDLCGTAVGFKFASALFDHARKQGRAIPQGREKWLLDLVAIATVTDVMKLTGENRVLETFGLKVLNKTRRTGLLKLLQTSGGALGELTTTSIGFHIGPRLNAAGRMTHATEALRLLTETDPAQAHVFASHLEQTNRERQALSRRMYEEALTQVSNPQSELIIVSDPNWSPGLVGLVAGKLMNQYNLPVFVVGSHEGMFVGSGRAPEGFHITQLMQEASEFLDRFGGHPQACGFSVKGEERFAQAANTMKKIGNQWLKDIDVSKHIPIDAELNLSSVSWSLFEELCLFAPFGQGNEEPVFCAMQVEVARVQSVGAQQQHLKLTLRSGSGTLFPAIGFGFGSQKEEILKNKTIDLAFRLTKNTWNGRSELQLHIVDIHV